DAGCVLKISGVSESVRRQLVATRVINTIGAANVYSMTSTLTQSTLAAKHDAEEWIKGNLEPEAEDASGEGKGAGGWLRDAVRWGRVHLLRRSGKDSGV
ncbi:MAG TPA: hypothetical protein VIP98_08240, partial [Microlunatus sp.]